eukprot:CAMPEP_0119102100 /NCGR_PEP_ID=MMETSP1180-20130426/957_1 /TAXON_ID=3052 ORGANISM="Chlamydomonas cf sp, Strain CCMP681" /NCGR_SAMPLE_ID=MMETSP1180 /ASSEMBLY_ACC=CAM_ASM_000741 /LENGTH=713 /DNA_ID=CAMNT_0007086327 /DNA_START=55 /DNA_END=2196 /DNA_ORIENTATION=+
MAEFGATRHQTEERLPKATRVVNKAPADRQITAEQILREAKEIRLEDDNFKPPKQIITDPNELAEYRLRKRKEFEDMTRRVGRFSLQIWAKYATWEEQQKDFRRARSVWERALDINHRHLPFWLKYAEMEMRNRFINHARNVWDRAVTLLPRIDQLWYKYIHMEEMLSNVAGARQVFDRWMRFEPDHQGWMAYVKFELRYEEVARARQVFERYVQILPSVKAWVRYAKFEFKNGEVTLARQCYERATEEMGEDAQTEEFYIAFATFEEMSKEHDRARNIYKYALDHIPKAQAVALYQRFVTFEKQHGDRQGIEDVVVSKRRFQYEEAISQNPLNYDTWFDYIKLEEEAGDVERVREVYERAVSNLPPANEKRYWQRYIYLWIKYALYEELEADDSARAREVYRAALKLVPHHVFTFSKLWMLAAKLEVRSKRLDAARRILGTALGVAPKDKTFKSYIELELQIGNVDRCRILYEKYLEWSPANCHAWIKFAELEKTLGETARTRSIYELAIAQPVLDMPESLWKGYIDFEISEGERQRTRVLYERLLDRTKHVKVWLSFARFEATLLAALAAQDEQEQQEAQQAVSDDPGEGQVARCDTARAVYVRALRSLRETQPGAKDEAVMLLEAWREFEEAQTWRPKEEQQQSVQAVLNKMPKKVKRKRPVRTEEGLDAGMEEYWDWIFPEETGSAPHLKLLELAYKHKKQKLGGADDP